MPEDSWTAKEVFADLKGDLINHLDKQDVVLHEIKGDLGGKADKTDLVPILARLDNHHDRIQTIEDARRQENAVLESKWRTRRWVWGGITAVVVPIGVALIIVFVH